MGAKIASYGRPGLDPGLGYFFAASAFVEPLDNGICSLFSGCAQKESLAPGQARGDEEGYFSAYGWDPSVRCAATSPFRGGLIRDFSTPLQTLTAPRVATPRSPVPRRSIR
jgi:hypothetical protein